MSETKQEILKQIGEAWKSAQRQLEELRTAVQRTGELAQIKLQGEALNRDLDRAYRDLGEAVWSEVKSGMVTLPSSVEKASRSVEEAERKLAAQIASINEIIAEGSELAGKMLSENDRGKAGAGKPVAPRGKKE